uniref:hypothetical protein n=1 Tax=Bacillus maqinnsis TaxID=3229854 RepID=UPI003EBFF008
MKYVIIGGDAAGMSCHAKIYREDSDAHIVALEKGEIYSYRSCRLPYFIGRLIDITVKAVAQSVSCFWCCQY